jgi:hypothetical protein
MSFTKQKALRDKKQRSQQKTTISAKISIRESFLINFIA